MKQDETDVPDWATRLAEALEDFAYSFFPERQIGFRDVERWKKIMDKYESDD